MAVTWSWNTTADGFWQRMSHDPPPLDNLWRELRPPDTHAYEKRAEPKPQPKPRPRPQPTRKQTDPFTARQEQIGLNILNRINQEKNP